MKSNGTEKFGKVDPLVMKALELVWRQQKDFDEKVRAQETAEVLMESKFIERAEFRDGASDVVVVSCPLEWAQHPHVKRIINQTCLGGVSRQLVRKRRVK